MPQKSPVLTLGLGHSGGASCSGNALRGALSAHTIVHFRLCAIFLHAPWAVETRCYFSLVSHGKTRKAFSAPQEVRGDRQSNGQGNCKILFIRPTFNKQNKSLDYSSNIKTALYNLNLNFTTVFTSFKVLQRLKPWCKRVQGTWNKWSSLSWFLGPSTHTYKRLLVSSWDINLCIEKDKVAHS